MVAIILVIAFNCVYKNMCEKVMLSAVYSGKIERYVTNMDEMKVSDG